MIAEGVETPATWALITNCACDQTQGHFVARPMSSTKLLGWLHAIGRPTPISMPGQPWLVNHLKQAGYPIRALDDDTQWQSLVSHLDRTTYARNFVKSPKKFTISVDPSARHRKHPADYLDRLRSRTECERIVAATSLCGAAGSV